MPHVQDNYSPQKGLKSEIPNYRSVANLSSTSQIFKKSILHRIKEIQTEHACDLKGKSFNGFKKIHSNTTAELALQS